MKKKLSFVKLSSILLGTFMISLTACDQLHVHNYTVELAEAQYFKSEANFDRGAEYYKSCTCGAVGEDTFVYGEALERLPAEEQVFYQPKSLTVTLYDAEESIYGFTYNTDKEPLRPVLQIQKGNELTADCEEYAATVKQETTNLGDVTYYIAKVTAELEPSCTYAYRIYDKHADTATETVIFETKDTTSDSFTFAHISDSQVFGENLDEYAYENTGLYFGKVLSKLVDNNDFILHTGDIVERSSHENFWTEMLHTNFDYLSKIPLMALSGNHDTTYKAGKNELFKHFNNKLPEQSSTHNGYYYSFEYGHAKFIMLNTNNMASDGIKREQYDWLVDELKNNEAMWTIVAMHNPMYGVGKWGANPAQNEDAITLRKQLQGVFAEYGVDIVLQGHDHTVARSYPLNGYGVAQAETIKEENGIPYSVRPNGVIYLQNGTAGNQIREPFSFDESLYSYGLSSYECSWAEFEMSGRTMTVTLKYIDGDDVKVYRQWGIKKSA